MQAENDRTTAPQAGGKKRRSKKSTNPEGQGRSPATEKTDAQPLPQQAAEPEPQTPKDAQAAQAPEADPATAAETDQQAEPAAVPEADPQTTPAAPEAEVPQPSGDQPASEPAEPPRQEAAPSAEQPEQPAQETEKPEAPEPAEVPQTPQTQQPAPDTGHAEAQTEEAEPAQPPEEAAEKAEETEEEKEKEPAAEEPAQDPQPGPDQENEEKRLSDMTRTVQLSVAQILARVEEEPGEETAAPEQPAPEETAEEDAQEETPATLQEHLRSGLSGVAKWLLLVLFFVLVIAGVGVAWLYRSATPDMLPHFTVTFAGQEVEPSAYKWKVPVVGNLFKRTYAETFSSTPVELAEPVEQASPDFLISPTGYRTEVTITDSQDQVLFEGDTDSFSAFQFTANGTYTARLVVYGDASSVPGDAAVTGSTTWQFTFTVGVRPSIRLSSTTVNQGSVVAVQVGKTLDGQPPQIQTDLENAGFYPAASGWVCYLPIPWNQPADTQQIQVTVGSYTQTLELKVRAADWEYKDYYSESQRATPYIGQGDLPAELNTLLQQSEDAIAWSDGNFVQPFLNTIDVKAAYGTTEYVGRSYSERSTNTGAGGRTFTNMVLNTSKGELLIAPASGTVVLAKDLGGDLGYTLVIDHGAGVKSLFYNLQSCDVKAGASVKQGQVIGACGRTTVAEMRIGTVPIDPLPVWRGQCDALKYY